MILILHFRIILQNLNYHYKNRNLFDLHIFFTNAVYVPGCYVKAIQDDITSKTVPIWLHHTEVYKTVCLGVAVHPLGQHPLVSGQHRAPHVVHPDQSINQSIDQSIVISDLSGVRYCTRQSSFFYPNCPSL